MIELNGSLRALAGRQVRRAKQGFVVLIAGLALAAPAMAAQPPATPGPVTEAAQGVTPEAAPAEPATPAGTAPAASQPSDGSLPGYTPMKPTEGIGMPRPGEITLQKQFSPNGRQAAWMNDVILTPLIVVISIFVLGLLLWVMVRYNRRANKVASTNSHNTLIEVIWTAVPVLILVVIAVPSIDLLAAQYKPAPKDAVTVKVTGYQWYWGYSYPDHGGFEVVSNMLKEDEAKRRGEPALLAVDNRMVVPAGVPLRIQTTGADVIHSFAVPSLWFKLDTVPGRLNEKQLLIERPGVYYGQCSELCGARHAFMPIAIEALPPAQFAAWIRAKGGTMPGEAAAAAPASDGSTPARAAPPAEGGQPVADTELPSAQATAAARGQSANTTPTN